MAFSIASLTDASGPIRAGIDSFLAGTLHEGRNVGLVTNHTGATAEGVPTWKAMLNTGVRLAAIFGPEHGFRGEAQDAVHVADETFHGVRVYSLYGETLRPTSEMYNDLDLIVFDIQDVGCRYYTYLQTLGYTLEAAAQRGIPYVVLDRPNPIGGVQVEGGPIAREHESFVGAYALAHRYGMSIGEFAHYLHNNFVPDVDLTVVPVQGWDRSMMETPIPWILPSPNLATIDACLCYPGTCLIEGTNVSEGRGTARPFEMIGAPWIDGERLRETLAALNLPGVVFTSIFFTPTFSKHRGTQCSGITVHPLDREAFRPLLTGIAILRTLRDMYDDRFEWRKDWDRDGAYFFDRLAGGPDLRTGIDSGASIADLYAEACSGQDEFMDRRASSLLYR